MAGKLAYVTDAELRKKLFAFWGIRKIDAFFDKPPSGAKVLFALLKLEEAESRCLGHILERLVARGVLVATPEGFRVEKDEPVPASEVKEDSVAIDVLDSLRVIERRRDRASLSDEGDKIALIEPLRSWLASCRHIPGEKPRLPLRLLDAEEKELVDRVYRSWICRGSAFLEGSLERITSLVEEGVLQAGLDAQCRPGVSCSRNPSSPDEGDPTLAYDAIDAPTLVMLRLEAGLIASKLGKRAPSSEPPPAPHDAETWKALVSRAAHEPDFLRKGLVDKMRCLLAHETPRVRRWARRIAGAVGNDSVFHPAALRRALARREWERPAPPVVASVLGDGEVDTAGPVRVPALDLPADVLGALARLGLVLPKNGFLALNGRFLRKCLRKPKPPARPAYGQKPRMRLRGDFLQFDSDFQMSVYRQSLNCEMRYALSCVAEWKGSDHVLTGTLSSDTAAAWLARGRSLRQAWALLKRLGVSTASAELRTHLRGLFGETRLLHRETRVAVRANSRAVFEELRKIATESGIDFRTEGWAITIKPGRAEKKLAEQLRIRRLFVM